VQPVVVGFNATDMFNTYAGGLWLASECQYTNGSDGRPDADLVAMNHALLIVGFNMSTGPPFYKPYWYIAPAPER